MCVHACVCAFVRARAHARACVMVCCVCVYLECKPDCQQIQSCPFVKKKAEEKAVAEKAECAEKVCIRDTSMF